LNQSRQSNADQPLLSALSAAADQLSAATTKKFKFQKHEKSKTTPTACWNHDHQEDITFMLLRRSGGAYFNQCVAFNNNNNRTQLILLKRNTRQFMGITEANLLNNSSNVNNKKAKLSKMEQTLRVKKLSEHATIPVRGSEGAAGYDLSSAYDYTIKAKSKDLVKTDLSIAIPLGTYARIAPRSGLAHKHFIDVGAGVVDYDYRGNVGVILFNFSDVDFEIKKGDRVAQMILEQIVTPECVEVDDLDATDRGAGGFGSTGVGAAK